MMTAVAAAVGRSAVATVLSTAGRQWRWRYGGDAASAGNGGIAGVSADGGIVVIDEINSGGNQGNTIEVGDICAAPVFVPEAPAKPGKPGEGTW